MSTNCGHFRLIETCAQCLAIQKKWYRNIKKKGFEDIEDQRLGVIKRWTGISFIEQHSQAPYMPIQSTWPKPNFEREEELLNHPDFKIICKGILKHKNNTITVQTMVKIWESHCQGKSTRQIELEHNINDVTVFRAIRKLKGLINIMDLDQSVVVIRKYNPDEDNKLIFSTWRNAVWYDTHTLDEMDQAFYRWKTKEIKTILNLPDIEVRVACSQNNKDHIIGYSVMNKNKIEFVYIKVDYRKEGIATLLTKDFSRVAKPTTKIGMAIIKNHDLRIEGDKEDGSTREETKGA